MEKFSHMKGSLVTQQVQQSYNDAAHKTTSLKVYSSESCSDVVERCRVLLASCLKADAIEESLLLPSLVSLSRLHKRFFWMSGSI